MIAMLSGSTLGSRLKELVEESDGIDIAVAWATDWSGLDLVMKIANRSGRDRVRIIVGVNDYITTPNALKKMSKYADLRIYGQPAGRLFHPKLYIFRKREECICWVGSANLTKRAFNENVETVVEFKDLDGKAAEHFGKLWKSQQLATLGDFDLSKYEAGWNKRRALIMAAGLGIVEGDEPTGTENVESTHHKQEVKDTLLADWSRFAKSLTNIPGLEKWIDTLKAGSEFIKRDWSNDLTPREVRIMFGQPSKNESFVEFGKLRLGNKNNFVGSSLVATKNRVEVGKALREITALKQFSAPLVQKNVERLMQIKGCKYALTTRLLVLARPEWFVVANKKSFKGLGKQFGLALNKSLKPVQYVKLIEAIHRTPWWRSPPPNDPTERQLWAYRAALLDPIVYEETEDKFADD